jgi:hypothetical protein
MPLNLILLIAALVVSWLVFSWLLRVVKASLTTAVAIALIILVLQIAFGIKPEELWLEITRLPQTLQCEILYKILKLRPFEQSCQLVK